MSDPVLPTDLASRLARSLSALMQGESLPLSESSQSFYKSFHARLAASTELNAESFRVAAGIGPRFDVRFQSAEEFFEENLGQELDLPEKDEEELQAYSLLGSLMKAALSDLRVAIAWLVINMHIRFYLFGRLEDGSLAGLKAPLIS